MVVVNGVAGVAILVVSVVLSAGTLAAVTKGMLWTLKRRTTREQ